MDKMIYEEFRKDIEILKKQRDIQMSMIDELDLKLMKAEEDIQELQRDFYRCNPPKAPETFCMGDWVVRIVGKNEGAHKYGRIFRIESLNEGEIEDADKKTHFRSSLRHATNEEIRNYLMCEAINRGFIAGTRFSWISKAYIYTIAVGVNWEYIPETDGLVVSVDESRMKHSVYFRGSWATIYNKKKLPRTKEEFNTFLGQWANRHTPTTEEFLDDYEDT